MQDLRQKSLADRYGNSQERDLYRVTTQKFQPIDRDEMGGNLMGDEDSMQELDEAYNDVPTRYKPIEADTPQMQNFKPVGHNNIIKYQDTNDNLRKDPWDREELKEEKSMSSPNHNSFSYNGAA